MALHNGVPGLGGGILSGRITGVNGTVAIQLGLPEERRFGAIV